MRLGNYHQTVSSFLSLVSFPLKQKTTYSITTCNDVGQGTYGIISFPYTFIKQCLELYSSRIHISLHF
jgi:hypothetical protein